MSALRLVTPLFVFSVLACSPARDDTPSVGRETAAITVVPNLSTGISSIEGRRVYAPPDEGEFTVPLTLDFSLPGELNIQEPSMLTGEFSAHVKYSKKHNTVDITVHFKGLPYRGTFTKDFDDSTAFNEQLVTVTNAHWQFWMMGTVFGRYHETLYYDATSLKFLGTKWDFVPFGSKPFPADGTFITAPANAIRMVCSPFFEPNPDGSGDFHYQLQYDHIADLKGSPGVINTVQPFDLCEPDQLENYWTNTRLSDDMYMTWDYFLQSIWNGEGIGMVMTAEPYPKPDFLAYRDTTFVGPGNMYPQSVPWGFGMDFLTAANGPGGGSVIPIHGHTYQLSAWPPSTRHLCGGGGS